MIYFTSDLHFGHENVIRFDHRPFASAEEMDETLIERWNNKVSDTDSLNVYDEMKRLCAVYEQFTSVSEESIAIMALFHDLCKVNFYKPDTRNVKKDGVWVAVPTYSVKEKFPFGGHGSKSMFIVHQFIQLTPEEACAINCHMGLSEHERSIGDAYEAQSSAWLLHVADEAATFLIEKDEEE